MLGRGHKEAAAPMPHHAHKMDRSGRRTPPPRQAPPVPFLPFPGMPPLGWLLPPTSSSTGGPSPAGGIAFPPVGALGFPPTSAAAAAAVAAMGGFPPGAGAPGAAGFPAALLAAAAAAGFPPLPAAAAARFPRMPFGGPDLEAEMREMAELEALEMASFEAEAA
ncbi:hypothetical protein FJT64_001424 [Amphibalanus amphitrite]|uniref:Uncharacterized protein n=1 Tax=Amphibalanus amphitrite TaxID=1232801 RepID=A0A6A4V8C4_AMPAM|nr:hypothetical protein FJT64_001424 [Amphibalanus amphitrite]